MKTERDDNVVPLYRKNSSSACEELKNDGYLSITEDDIWKILAYELNHTDNYSDIFWHYLTKDEIIEIVKNYYKKYGFIVSTIQPEFDTQIELFEDDNGFSKGTVKQQGVVWRIHKNDVDTRPSSPHAHDYERNRKLHLGNGTYYRSGEVIGKMRKSDFKKLRELIEKRVKDITLPEDETI